MITKKQLKESLKCYHQDVPFIGTITEKKVHELFEEGIICRGWMTSSEGLEYFHIIRSPKENPELIILSAQNEDKLFEATLYLGQQHKIDIETLFK